jgi:septum formation protein
MKKIILGSKSPRRKEILSYYNIPFEQVGSAFDEDSIIFNGNPETYVTDISKGKAEILSHIFPNAIILTADSTVYFEGKIYNKPAHYEEAFHFLSQFQGKWQSVWTGLTLYKDKNYYHQAEESKLLLNPLNETQIHVLLSKINWSDLAGGFTIENTGSLLVNKIEGCYYNILGLPVNCLHSLLLKIGINVWHYLD